MVDLPNGAEHQIGSHVYNRIVYVDRTSKIEASHSVSKMRLSIIQID